MIEQMSLGIEIPEGAKENVFEVIKDLTGKCRDCGLGLLFPNNYGLIWRGNPEATLAWIGEMPADNEWRKGQAMVGPSGEVMTYWGEILGIDINKDSFIINVVQCLTPLTKKKGMSRSSHRPPDKGELAICMPRCLRVLRAMPNLKVAVLLGTVAKEQFLGPSIGIPGDWYKNEVLLPGVMLYVMPHPASLLNEPSDEKDATAERFLERLKEVMNKMKKGEPI
jgi:DNA polymerase